MRKSERQSIASIVRQTLRNAWGASREAFDFLIVAFCVIILVVCWHNSLLDED
jgi:hypothetical protein